MPIQQFIQQVKTADNSKSREIKLDITQAKNLAFTLGIVMARLNGGLEDILARVSEADRDEDIVIKFDGGEGF